MWIFLKDFRTDHWQKVQHNSTMPSYLKLQRVTPFKGSLKGDLTELSEILTVDPRKDTTDQVPGTVVKFTILFTCYWLLRFKHVSVINVRKSTYERKFLTLGVLLGVLQQRHTFILYWTATETCLSKGKVRSLVKIRYIVVTISRKKGFPILFII